MSSAARRRLFACVGALPRRQRTLLALSRLEQLTPAQMAAILGTDVATVRRSLVLAERALRREVHDSTTRTERPRWRA